MKKILIGFFLSLSCIVSFSQVGVATSRYDFENSWVDSVGTNTLLPKNGATFGTSSPYQGSYYMDANINNSTRAITNKAVNLGTGFIYFSFMMRTYAAAGYPVFIDNRVAGSGSGLYLQGIGGDGRLFLYTSDGVNTGSAYTATDAYLRDGTWQYVLIEINTADDVANIYLNNVKVSVDSTIEDGFLANDTISIGARRDGGYGSWGNYDNFQIYVSTTRMLSAQRDSLYDLNNQFFNLGGVEPGEPEPPEPPASTGHQTSWYFSNDGNDSPNDGTSGFPFATMTKLSSLISADSIQAGDTVLFERGSVWDNTYMYINGLSGTASDSILFTCYGNPTLAKPLITGLKTITNSFTNIGGNLWVVTDSDMPNYVGTMTFSTGDWANFRRNLPFIFVNGQKYSVSKHPNTPKTYYPVSTTDATGMAYFSSATTWSNGYWNGAEVMYAPYNWVMAKANVSSYSGGTFYLTSGTVFNGGEDLATWHNPAGGSTVKFFITNHANAADVHGEYVYNATSKQLTVYFVGNPNSYEIKVPVREYVFHLNNCDYLKFDSLEFHSGTIASFYSYLSDHITVTNCKVAYAGGAGLMFGDNTYVTATQDTLIDCTNIGIAAGESHTVNISNNVLKNIGIFEGLGGDFNSWNHVGIQSRYPDNGSPLTIEKNKIDGVGLAGIMFFADEAGTPGAISIYRNLVKNFAYLLNDCGGIYTIYNVNNVSKVIRGNVVYNGIGNKNFHLGGNASEVHGIYLDNYNGYFTVDSNTVWKAASGLFLNGGQNNHVIRNNLLVAPMSPATDVLQDWRSPVSFEAMQMETAAPWQYPDNVEFYKNTIVGLDSFSMARWNYHISFNDYNFDLDSNYYFNTRRETTTQAFRTLLDFGSPTLRTLAQWYAYSGFDQHSSFNQNNWVYNDVDALIADPDDFAWLFVNWSNEDHTFAIGDVHFVDTASFPYSIEDSLFVPSYSTKLLFYVSGDVSTITENTIYENPLAEAEEPIIPTVPPPIYNRVIIYIKR